MICKNCCEEYDEQMFQVCPYCLSENVVITEMGIGENVCLKESEVEQNFSSEESFTQKQSKDKCNNENLENNCFEKNEHIGTKEKDIEIIDIQLFTKRTKNILRRNGIFMLSQLKECVKKNQFSQLRHFGPQCKSEVMLVLQSDISMITKKNKENLTEGLSKSNSSKQNITSHGINKLFHNINEQLWDLNISMLIAMGIKPRTLQSLSNRKISKIGQLKNISVDKLCDIVGDRNIKKFEAIQDNFEKDLVDLFKNVLNELSLEDDFKFTLMRSKGYTLQEIGKERGITRERVRQLIKKFNKKLTPFMEHIIRIYKGDKEFITIQEIINVYNIDDFDKVLIYWCKCCNELEYLDFADVFVWAEKDKKLIQNEIFYIVSDFVGKGINLYENMEDLESMMQDNGYPYVNSSALINFLQKQGYKFYGNYVVFGKQSYGYLCAKVVAQKFPNGLKLYGGKDLDLLRRYVLEEYGDIGVPIDNRAFSTRLCDYLILRGRGEYISSENIQVDMDMLEQIKDYIDQSPEGEIYYAELFAKFEGIIRMMSNIDNYNFLHGVLMMYYPNDYDYTRDYLNKKGMGFKSRKHSDKIKEFILEQKRPVHKNEIKKKFPGITDVVLINAVMSSKELFQWDYHYYTSTAILEISNDIFDYLYIKIDQIMKKNNGYCSDNLLIDEVKKDHGEFLVQNHIQVANNLYFLCANLFSDKYDFKRPHIVRKGVFESVTVRNVALQLLNYPNELSFEKYMEVTNQLKWSHVTAGMVFTDIETEYIRISKDLYIKKDCFDISDTVVQNIESILISNMKNDMVSLIGFESWEQFPKIKYEWNTYLLHAIVEKYSSKLKIIETRAKDRRYERGIIVMSNINFTEYIDVIIHFLKVTNRNVVSESDMLTLLIINGLTYKTIPKELFTSDKLIYKNEKFVVS